MKTLKNNPHAAFLIGFALLVTILVIVFREMHVNGIMNPYLATL